MSGIPRKQSALVALVAALAIILSVPIVWTTLRDVNHFDRIARSAAAEIAGIREIGRVLTTLDVLGRARLRLAQRRLARADDETLQRAIVTSVATIEDEQPESRTFNAAIGATHDLLVRRVATLTRPATVAAISDLIDATLPLLTEISRAAKISYDPDVAQIDIGDALTARFPPALEFALRSALLAQGTGAGGHQPLARRFEADRDLANADALMSAGVADLSDALAEQPRLGLSAQTRVADARAAFADLQQLLMDGYIEGGPRAPHADRIDSARDRFVAATSALALELGAQLEASVKARIANARALRGWIILAGVAALALDAAAMLLLAQLMRRRYQRALKRADEAQSALDAQRAHARSERALLVAQAQFRAVFDRAPHGMILIDAQSRLIDANDSARSMFGAAPTHGSIPRLLAERAQIIADVFAGTRETYEAELQITGADGRVRWVHLAISLVHDDQRVPFCAIAIVYDISERRALQDRLMFDATHDPLTGLPNRKLFIDLLQSSIERESADRPAFSVLFVDFNDFKTINDSLGHSAGDHFLIGAAVRLRAAVRGGDVVARLGGDEFGILLYEDGPDAGDDSLDRAMTRLQSAAAAGIEIDGLPVATSASFGVARSAAHYTRAEEMLRDADTAMYQAKRQGTRAHVVFDRAMHETVVRRMQLATDLTQAVSGAEFELLYQPIVALDDGRVVGCEALIRWRRGSDARIITPADFIPLAEESGTIVEIGHWVMATACEQLRDWEDNGTIGRDEAFTMHVNLSVPEVYARDVAGELNRALRRTGVRAERIMLEITETLLLESSARTHEVLQELKALGLALCIDDFGTGYSSLRYLHQLPLDGFKIDRSFISAGGDDLANAPIVEMLLILARSLGLEVIAEGIETARQWESLRQLGCRLGQGFLFAHPLAAAEFGELIVRSARAQYEPNRQPERA